MNREGSKGQKTLTRTVRLEEETDRRLESIAKKEGVSVNLLINKALRKYSEWEYPSSKYGVVTQFSTSFRRLFTYLSDEDVKDFGKWEGKTVFREFVLFWFKTFNLKDTFRAIKLLGYSGRYECEDNYTPESYTIICEHNLGVKCSLYYSEMFKYVFQQLEVEKVKIETGENQVLIELSRQELGDEDSFGIFDLHH